MSAARQWCELERNASAETRRNGQRSRRLLKTAGSTGSRAAGSLGLWDPVGIGRTDIVGQINSNRPPLTARRETLALFSCTPNCKRRIHNGVIVSGGRFLTELP
ncbi:MAG: hypothetical protein ACHQ9S_23920 [Candidatus Binatia bacterium]